MKDKCEVNKNCIVCNRKSKLVLCNKCVKKYKNKKKKNNAWRND